MDKVIHKWADAPDWQRISAIKGVEMIVANPATTPEQSHEGWLAEKSVTGWKYGPVFRDLIFGNYTLDSLGSKGE